MNEYMNIFTPLAYQSLGNDPEKQKILADEQTKNSNLKLKIKEL